PAPGRSGRRRAGARRARSRDRADDARTNRGTRRGRARRRRAPRGARAGRASREYAREWALGHPAWPRLPRPAIRGFNRDTTSVRTVTPAAVDAPAAGCRLGHAPENQRSVRAAEAERV